MGHEVSHALANHGAQRMKVLHSCEKLGVGVAVATSGQSQKHNKLEAYGIGTEVGVMLPFSRANETEADKIGLTLMAIAGYNPDEAIAFWSRMAAKFKWSIAT
jgi:predicted Zn-dependent protease